MRRQPLLASALVGLALSASTLAAGQAHPVPIFNSCTYKFTMGATGKEKFTIVQSSNYGAAAVYTYTLRPGTSAAAGAKRPAAGKVAQIHGATHPEWLTLLRNGKWIAFNTGGNSSLGPGEVLCVGEIAEVVIEAPNGAYVHIKGVKFVRVQNGELAISDYLER